MTELNIPIEAIDPAAEALTDYNIPYGERGDAAVAVLRAAGPVVVAAELRRLHDAAARSDMETFDDLLRALWARADELDLSGAERGDAIRRRLGGQL